jgi:anti-sigma B factor antagonist
MAVHDPQLSVTRDSGAIVLTGEIDAHTAGSVRDELLRVRVPAAGDLRVDLSNVTFIDSSGLRIILEVHQEMQRNGRRLVLLDPSKPVARLVEIAGLASQLHLDEPDRPADWFG